MITYQTYKGIDIAVDYMQAQPFTVIFDRHEGDFGDYDTMKAAKHAIDRFVKPYEEPDFENPYDDIS